MTTSSIDPEAWERVCGLIGFTNRHLGGYVEISANDMVKIVRAILEAEQRGAEKENKAIADYIEGKGGIIPGTAVFAPLVSRNNQPCMSGDPRDRLHSHTRRDFDDATSALAAAIRGRKG